MVKNGFISADAAASVDPASIRIQQTTNQNSVRYFTDWALPQLDQLIDETSDPIDVWTTLDPGMQAAADRAIRADAPKGVQGALVSMDRDGAVRAMVGGKDYVDSIYNRATQADTSARIGVQALRLSQRSRIGHEADGHDRGRAGDDRRLEPAQLDADQPRAGEPARSLLSLDQHHQRQDRCASRLHDHR